MKCYVCGVESDYICVDCSLPMCDTHTASRSEYNMIEEDICEACQSDRETIRHWK